MRRFKQAGFAAPEAALVMLFMVVIGIVAYKTFASTGSPDATVNQTSTSVAGINVPQVNGLIDLDQLPNSINSAAPNAQIEDQLKAEASTL